MPVNHVAIQVQDNAIVVQGSVNGKDVEFIIDSGDALGPTFTSSDAERLGLQPSGELGVEGAGGASAAYSTTASVTLGADTYPDEPCAIDPDLQGNSLIGLPFFLRECKQMSFDFVLGYLTMVS